MDSPPMLDCTPSAYWPLILAYVLPPVGAVLSAIALLVASRARSTSQDAQSTSLGVADSLSLLPEPLERRGSRTAARDRKK
jgi:hypothetical protein